MRRAALIAVLAQAAALSTQAVAQVSATAELVSDYRFRGISWSNGNPAAQGGITASHASGFYAGAWASTLSGWGTRDGADVEVDLFGGYRTDIGGAVLDAGLLWYVYPGSGGTDVAELFASLGTAFGPGDVEVGVNFAPRRNALEHDNWYVYGDAKLAILGSPLTLKAHLGYTDGKPAGLTGWSFAPAGSYLDWRVGVDLSWSRVTLGLAYVDTDIDRAGPMPHGLRPSMVQGTLVASLTASF